MSRLHRAYSAPDREWARNRFVLDERESHHLTKVLRLRKGDEVEVFNGRGEVRKTVLVDVVKHKVELESKEIIQLEESVPSFVLGVAVPKGKKMDEIVRQATEMGVNRLVPLVTSRSETPNDQKRRASKLERWRIAAIEACKQSGNAFVPHIDSFRPLDDWLKGLSPSTFRIVASLEPDAQPLRRWLTKEPSSSPPTQVVLLVGPEGDLSSEEYDQARAHRFLPCDLGENVLRVDTAVVCAFAIAKEEFRAYLDMPPVQPNEK